MSSRPGSEETLLETSPAPTGDRALAHIDTVIDRFRVKRQLGAGGMGVVYEAHDPELKRDVAVKLLRRPDGGGELQARLLREAQAMAQVAHPNVIAVYDVGTWREEVFLAMELATGGTLRAWCKDKSPREILDAYIAAGRGLAAAHAVGLVHRDFKPDNVLVGGDGRIRVTDFGLARSHDMPAAPGRASQPLGDLTMTGAVIGTPAYMASELFAGKPADARTDQFAFCIAVWEALYGKRPFDGNTMAELADTVAAGRVSDPPAKKGVSRAVERALRRGLAAEPADRWPAMEALLAELAPPPRRTWLYVAAAGVLVIGGGVAIAAAMWPHPQPVVAHTPADARADAIDPVTFAALRDIVALDDQIDNATKNGNVDEERRLDEQRLERARGANSREILADTLISHADVMRQSVGDNAAAEHALREARRLAEAIGDDKLKARAAIDLATVLELEGKREEAADIRALSSATASHANVDDATRAATLEEEAGRARDTGDAIAKWNAALALREKSGTSSLIATNRVGLANTLAAASRTADARDVLLAALPLVDKQPSSEDEAMATFGILTQLATLENSLARWDDAEAHARRAIAIAEAKTVAGLVGHADYGVLGGALLGRGDRAGAERAFQHVIDKTTTPALHAEAVVMIGIAYHTHHDEKTAIKYVAMGAGESEKANGADAEDTLTYKLLLCKLLVADGQQARALPIAEEILPKIEKLELGPVAIGDAQFALARALPKSAGARAHQLAKSALEMLAKGGPVGADHATLVTEWLSKQ